MNWQVGERFRRDADYGEQFVSTLSTQLSWRRFIEILPSKVPLEREFYAGMCRV